MPFPLSSNQQRMRALIIEPLLPISQMTPVWPPLGPQHLARKNSNCLVRTWGDKVPSHERNIRCGDVVPPSWISAVHWRQAASDSRVQSLLGCSDKEDRSYIKWKYQYPFPLFQFPLITRNNILLYFLM